MTDNEFDELKLLLDTEAARYNHPDFIAADPVQFVHRFTDVRDIEIVALLCSSIAWGNRRMICRSCERLLSLMDGQPHGYVMDRGWEDLPPHDNIHRTFFTDNLRHFLCGLESIYRRYGSLDAMAASLRPASGEWRGASWELAAAINRELCAANDGATDCRCLPMGLDKSALKRFNMALRWLVRRDGIVDLGVWDSIRPSELYIPLDVHVGNVSRELGLVSRKANDRRTVEELTATLRRMRPDDPVYYDYALFGIGVTRAHEVTTD